MSLWRAEQYIDDPPEMLGDPGTITLERAPEGGWVVLALEREQ